MNSRRRISALQRFAGKPIAIWDALEPVLMAGADGCLWPNRPPTLLRRPAFPYNVRSFWSGSGLKLQIRRACLADISEIERMIARSVMALMGHEYSLEQRRASIGPLFGVDRQIIEDGTYYVVEHAGRLVGSGGWSFRRTLFGGDGAANRDDSRVTPGVDPAHIRAFFIDPSAARTGVGTQILLQSEADAAADGFLRYEMMATLTGRAFYTRHGYRAGDEFVYALPGGLGFPLVHMAKARLLAA